MNGLPLWKFALALAIAGNSVAMAQPGPGFGRGKGGPGKAGMGHGPRGQAGGRHDEDHDARHDEDHEVFQFLLANHQKIRRTVKDLKNGVETLTESDEPAIASKIQEHVEWMTHRIRETQPIRMRDPLFAEIFQHTQQIQMEHTATAKGIKVTETSDDPYVVRLIQAHAKVVSGFVERGHAEAMKNHPVPSQTAPQTMPAVHPVIPKHGGVIPLTNASQPPRGGTKLLVDVTRGAEPTELNSALEKIARYVNIYAGVGAEPVSIPMAAIFHGDATAVVLNDDAYAAKFKTKGNPNLELLHRLHEAGVELYVCGQSLIQNGSKPDEVAIFVETAASAVTALVNLQADGYAYVPLGK
jgi:intracellular sulfur oxidation DsrE/DsrF family protein